MELLYAILTCDPLSAAGKTDLGIRLSVSVIKSSHHGFHAPECDISPGAYGIVTI